MKKIFIYSTLLCIIVTTSCKKNFVSINTNPGSFISAEPEAVLPGIIVNTVNRLELDNMQTMWETSHLIEMPGRYTTLRDDDWNTLYSTVLGNTVQLKRLFGSNAGYANRMAIVDIWECYVYAHLVGTYGPIPYSHVGQTDNPDIEYDSENDVYTSLLTRLKADAAKISTTGDKFTTDPIYGGDMTKWVKFANSLRLRIALTVQVNLPALATSNIQDVMANESTLLASDADDPKLSYGTATGSQSQYFVQLTQTSNYTLSSGNAPVMSDYVFTYFRSYKDPRLDAYFLKSVKPFNITDTLTSTSSSLHYVVSYPIPHLGSPKSQTLLSQWNLTSANNPLGTVPFSGATISNNNYSALQPAVVAATRPFYIMTYAEVCFMKAEAALKGYGGSQTPDAYYYAGVNANFAFWGLTSAQATAYLAQNGIKWGTAGKGFNYDLGFINTSISTDNLTKIYIQQWLNYYSDGGFEAWVLQRRTQNLKLPPHTNPGAANGVNTLYLNMPDRYSFATSESLINPNGYTNGVKLLGGPDYMVTTLKIEPAYTPVDWTKVQPFYDISFVQKWYGQNIEDLKAAGITYSVLQTY